MQYVFKKKLRIHFAGILGDGIFKTAILASKNGYKVTGCDSQINYPNAEKKMKLLLEHEIHVEYGNAAEHVEGNDILVVSPALLYNENPNIEVIAAKQKGILMLWQVFLMKYIIRQSTLICVTGTHGKTTTALILEYMFWKEKQNVIVIAGEQIIGNMNCFDENTIYVVECEEFNNNFLAYEPDCIILTNIELDHPEISKDFKWLLNKYMMFLQKIKKNGCLIANLNNDGVKKLLKKTNLSQEIQIECLGRDERSYFVKKSNEEKIELIPPVKLKIIGCHNQENFNLAYMCMKRFVNNKKITYQKYIDFSGVTRRCQKVYENDNLVLYNDFGHHPTELLTVIKAILQEYRGRKLAVIWEPNRKGRTYYFHKEYSEALKIAKKVFVYKTYKENGIDLDEYFEKLEFCGKKYVYVDTEQELKNKLKEEIYNYGIYIVFSANKYNNLVNYVKEVLSNG